jgi:hypothetical protein
VTDDVSAPVDADQDGAGEQGPEDLAGKVRRLEQLVAGILLADAAAGAEAAAEQQVPQIGTAAPVADTAVADAGGPWNWMGVDAERRTELAEDLTAFVKWLEERYLRHLSSEAYQFPANWYDNPVVVEVLTAVMVARQAAYSDMLAEPSSALSEWHERALWPALERLQSLNVFHDNNLVTRNRPAVTTDEAADALERAGQASARALGGHPAPVPPGEEPDGSGPAEPITEPIAVVSNGVRLGT